ncbi:cbb3-type cytochrome c oxidase N-terminal domain-containing protein [Poriferisphaera sp. WC338]|uniref:cbb3-type cytochrome c oxidase N-terminal domain-containing protein n=1 Tax=Poriferisphaera sp. WC338 TaxID=3425129 RepID=UPI003D8183C4
MAEHQDPNNNSEFDQLTGHNYDGIEEYDNPLPGWWVWLFWGTIIFSVIYFAITMAAGGYRQDGGVLAPVAEYNREKQFWTEKKLASTGELIANEETLVSLMQSEKLLESGKKIYAGKCAVCHAPNGAGLVGPNLTDDKYRNVKSILDVYTVIRDGAGNGSMPAHKTLLEDPDIILVSAYVASLRGQNLTGLAPQAVDVEIPAWPAP